MDTLSRPLPKSRTVDLRERGSFLEERIAFWRSEAEAAANAGRILVWREYRLRATTLADELGLVQEELARLERPTLPSRTFSAQVTR